MKFFLLQTINIADDSCSEQSDNHNEESDIEINSEICSGYIIADYHSRNMFNSSSPNEGYEPGVSQLYYILILMLRSSCVEKLVGIDGKIRNIIKDNYDKNIDIVITNLKKEKTLLEIFNELEHIDINIIRECITQQNSSGVDEKRLNDIHYTAEMFSESFCLLLISQCRKYQLKLFIRIKALFSAMYKSICSYPEIPSEIDDIDVHVDFFENLIPAFLLQISSESYINSLYDNKFECDDGMEDLCMRMIIQLSLFWHVLSFSGNFLNKELFKKIDDNIYIFNNKEYLVDKYITIWTDFEENDKRDKCLLPILSVNSLLNVRVFIQNTIYLLFLLNSHDFKIYVKNDADKEKIKSVIVKDFDVESKGDLTADFRKIFSDFKEFFEELNSCTARLSKYVNGIIVPKTQDLSLYLEIIEQKIFI